MIKVELQKKGIGYIELTQRLNKIGIEENQKNIANKINIGTFNFNFALQVFEILDMEIFRLKD